MAGEWGRAEGGGAKAWGGRFAKSDRPDGRGVYGVDLVRLAPLSSGHRRLYGSRPDARPAGDHHRRGSRGDHCTGLVEIEGEIERGEFAFDPSREDIHLNIEARLAEKIGDAAGKLHTARSRNDQVATDVRLWCRAAIDDLRTRILDLASGADRAG